MEIERRPGGSGVLVPQDMLRDLLDVAMPANLFQDGQRGPWMQTRSGRAFYPLDPQQAGSEALAGRKDPVMAFGVSFPSSDSGVKVEYAVDHLLWTQEYGPAD